MPVTMPLGDSPAEPIYLHVYDAAPSTANKVQYALFQHGVFHASVEVHGKEWSFGAGGGVYGRSQPGTDPNYPTHVTRIYQGSTTLSQQQVMDVVRRLKRTWTGDSYVLLSRNCCHFAEHLLEQIGGQPMPKWVNRAAETAVNDSVTTAARTGINGAAHVVAGRGVVAGAGGMAFGAVVGPAGWGALAGDLVGGRVGGHIGEAAAGDDGKEMGQLAGTALGSVGGGAAVGAFFGPVGAGIGAGVGASIFGVGKLVEVVVRSVS